MLFIITETENNTRDSKTYWNTFSLRFIDKLLGFITLCYRAINRQAYIIHTIRKKEFNVIILSCTFISDIHSEENVF